MINLSAKVKMPSLKIDTPEVQFWTGVGLTEVREIRKRTEIGRDAEEHTFKPYSPQYKAYRAKKGRRTAPPNLVFTGRMLGSMGRGIRAYRNKVTIVLSGEDGAKAWGNEEKGRQFFAISKSRAVSIVERVSAWMKKRNGLK